MGADGSDSVWELQGRYVRLAPQSGAPNEHPVQLSEAELAAALAVIEVRTTPTKRFNRKTSEDIQTPVFDEKETEVLGKALALGLARATPGQDVVFLITGDHDVGVRGLFKNHDLNAGRAFYRDGRLNLLFGEVHEAHHESGNKRGLIGAGDAPSLGSRNVPMERDWQILERPGIRQHHQGDDVRRDWVEIDVPVVLADLGWRAEEVQNQGFVPGFAASGGNAEAAAGVHEAGGMQTAESPAPSPAGRPVDLEEQLALLKRLRDKDLISQEVYDARVREVLDAYLP